MKERFGERIRRLRTEQKLGLREFATKVGISPTYLSRIETSEEKAPPAEEVIRKIATQLSDTFYELMTLAGRVSEESLNVIKSDPGMPEFLRTVGERKLSGRPEEAPSQRAEEGEALMTFKVPDLRHLDAYAMLGERNLSS